MNNLKKLFYRITGKKITIKIKVYRDSYRAFAAVTRENRVSLYDLLMSSTKLEPVSIGKQIKIRLKLKYNEYTGLESKAKQAGYGSVELYVENIMNTYDISDKKGYLVL